MASHGINEMTGKTGDTADADTTSGSLSFTDVDLTNHHTASSTVSSATWSGGASLPSGLATSLAAALATTVSTDSTGSGAGTVGFTFSAADSNFDFLAATETLTVTYNVTVTDNNGLTSTKPVTITITGTNDAPIAVADSAGGTENQTLTIDVLANDTDVDDGHVFTLVSATAPLHQGSARPAESTQACALTPLLAFASPDKRRRIGIPPGHRLLEPVNHFLGTLGMLSG